MDTTSKIVLTLENPSDGGPWVLTVRHRPSVLDPRQAIAKAVKDYLQTKDGKEVAAGNGGDFNYGDAANHIPDHILKRHGILELELHAESWSDNHDRNFNAEDE